MVRRILSGLTIWAFTAGTVCLASSASAEQMRTFKVGNWFAGAYTNDSTGQFNHCAGTTAYNSGIYVSFSISRNFAWSMAFGDPAWRLQPKSVFDVAFTIDDMPPISAKAVAVQPTLVEVQLDPTSELFDRFRRGHLLRVAAARQVFNFNLTGTSQLLPALLMCAKNHGTRVEMASNPFQLPANNNASPRDISASAEATTFAANLLSAAGIHNFTMLRPSDSPSIKGDARWIEGNTFGTVNVISNATPDELKEIPALLIGSDAKSCKGTFFSGALPDENSQTLGRVFTTCKTGNSTFTVYYLAVPRKPGGAYVIATASMGSEKPAKEADEMLRMAVFKALEQ